MGTCVLGLLRPHVRVTCATGNEMKVEDQYVLVVEDEGHIAMLKSDGSVGWHYSYSRVEDMVCLSYIVLTGEMKIIVKIVYFFGASIVHYSLVNYAKKKECVPSTGK